MSTTRPYPNKEKPSEKTRARRRWGVLPTLILLGAVAVVLVVSRPPEPTGPPVAVFPLPERYSDSYSNDWGAARDR